MGCSIFTKIQEKRKNNELYRNLKKKVIKMDFKERMADRWEALHKKEKWYQRIFNYFDYLFTMIKEIILQVLIPTLIVGTIVLIFFCLLVLL